MNSEQLSILESLDNIFVLNNQAAQSMILGRYGEASQILVQALESVSYALLACTTMQPTSLNTSVEIDIAWGTSAYQPDSSFTILSSSVFSKPLVLQAGPSKEGCNFLPPIAFAVVVNLGICRHIQALQHQDSSMSVSSNDDSLTVEKAIELYLQAGNISRMFQRGASHFELILLNNLGHAYEQLNCDLQTLICFQSLSIAAAEFRRVNASYKCNDNVQALVDNFLRWERRDQVVHFSFAAPVA